MINFTVYSADCVGNSGNCLYPNKMIVTDEESFIASTKMDRVTAKYKGNYRSKDNFEFSDCIPLDCDNDHSDNSEDWVTPFDIALEIPNVNFAASYSRHHMLNKGNKSARPRFHIFFLFRQLLMPRNMFLQRKGLLPLSPISTPMHLTVQDFFTAQIQKMLRCMRVVII